MAGLETFLRRYELPLVQDYTFLGTERSVEKPLVRYDGRIDLWYDPCQDVPWVRSAIEAGRFTVELVDGYLPAVRYLYRKPDSEAACEMTAFARDREYPGAIALLVRLVLRSSTAQQGRPSYPRLRGLPCTAAQFDENLRECRGHWQRFFRRCTGMPSSDALLLRACKASIVRALITFTGRHPHYGIERYAQTCHDGFPPTILALADCLIEWGQVELARDYLLYYFDRFVTKTGRFDYYGPSLAEYGQMLSLVKKLADACLRQSRCEGRARAAKAGWLEELRPKLDAICDWIWQEQAGSRTGLIRGVPEADTREQVDVYFHNNAWCWRGLRDISGLLERREAARCEGFRRTILTAIETVTDTDTDPPFIPPVARKIEPFQSMTQDSFASYTNYRYWPELLSSGILSRRQMEAIIRYRKTRDGEVGGMTHFADRADNWPIVEYGTALFRMGKLNELRTLLFSHLAGHTTPATWTAYEQVTTTASGPRRAAADYCVPVQLAAPRLLAMLRKLEPGQGGARRR